MEGFTAGAWADWRRSPSAMSPDSQSGSEGLRQGKIPVIRGSGETPLRAKPTQNYSRLALPLVHCPDNATNSKAALSLVENTICICFWGRLQFQATYQCVHQVSSQWPRNYLFPQAESPAVGRAGQYPIPDNQRPLLFTEDQKEQQGLSQSTRLR